MSHANPLACMLRVLGVQAELLARCSGIQNIRTYLLARSTLETELLLTQQVEFDIDANGILPLGFNNVWRLG